MRRPSMKKSLTTLTLTALTLTVSLIPGLVSRYSASAESGSKTSYMAATTSLPAGFAMQDTGVVLPKAPIYALNSDNTIFVLTPGTTSFTRLVRVTQSNGNLVGIDFRPSDGKLYALTDTNTIYTIDLSSANLGGVTKVNDLTIPFAGGFQALVDFNPVVDAVRLIGSNGQNYAVVNSGGNLNVTAVQTSLSYNAGDVNENATPSISAGSYTNSVAGATVTLFYAIDYALDTFVTIQPAATGGSSATGGGKLQTLGRLVTPGGVPVNVAPTADIDIYTDANGVNSIIGVSGRTLFTIDLAQINMAQALGTTKNVVARGITMPDHGGGFLDIAVATGAAPAPAPTPTPTPTPVAVTVFQAENGYLGGGAKVDTKHAGFTGTGFVDYADGVANSFVEFSVNHTGTKTLIFRYANGSTVNRTCVVTRNGTRVGTLSFPPTGAWTTWKTVSLSVNLGTGAGNKLVRVTSTTTAGGPNLDRLAVQ